MGELHAISQAPLCLVLIFLNEQRQMTEWWEVYATSIFLHVLENEMENMVSTAHCPSIYESFNLKISEEGHCPSQAKMKNVPLKKKL